MCNNTEKNKNHMKTGKATLLLVNPRCETYVVKVLKSYVVENKEYWLNTKTLR